MTKDEWLREKKSSVICAKQEKNKITKEDERRIRRQKLSYIQFLEMEKLINWKPGPMLKQYNDEIDQIVREIFEKYQKGEK